MRLGKPDLLLGLAVIGLGQGRGEVHPHLHQHRPQELVDVGPHGHPLGGGGDHHLDLGRV